MLANFIAAAFLFLPVFCVEAVYGGNAARIVGECVMPPARTPPLDYTRCRADAWFCALEQAENFLPAAALARLWEMGADNALGRQALTALVFSVETVTPDISSSRNIQVFLQYPENMGKKISLVLNNPEKLLLAMCFILELRNAMEECGKIWPKSEAEAVERAPMLDKYSSLFSGLWDVMGALSRDARERIGIDSPILKKASLLAPESAPLMLAASNGKLEDGLPQKALELADIALSLSESAIYADAPPFLKSWLLAYARYQLGLAHWKQDQTALAENDFREAAALAEMDPILHEFRARDLVVLGNLLRHKGDAAAMCNVFQQACALGSCASLAEARRRGQCSTRVE